MEELEMLQSLLDGIEEESMDCLPCAMMARHTGPDRNCPNAPWWDFYWDCRRAFNEVGISLDNVMTEEELRPLFEKGVGSLNVLTQYLEKFNAVDVTPLDGMLSIIGYPKTGGNKLLTVCRGLAEAQRFTRNMALPVL